ncbi:MAG: sialate O-acetylesterase [Defluviitaleaceae bacterium]|nr:sialate O-acetylesterase [Defluviitaleaceae bacterium]
MFFKLADHYMSGMIFQWGRPIYIEGEAYAVGKITAVLGDDRVEIQVQAGKFSLELPLRGAGRGLSLTIFGGEHNGNEQIEVLNDIYIGEVWIAGGQSNMEWPLNQSDEYRQHPHVRENADIRFYTVARNNFPHAADYGAGQQNHKAEAAQDMTYAWAHGRDSGWAGCGVANAPHFSAAGYFFAHRLYEMLGVPIGIINCNVGGSSIFSWIPREAILANEEIAFVQHEHDALVASQNDDDERARYHQALDVHAPFMYNDLNIGGTQWSRWFFRLEGAYSAYHYHRPSGLYHAMLEKIVRFPVRGMIWYQGETESNPHKSPHYAAALEALTANLRKQQRNDDYAFNFVQLAPWDCPGNDSWPVVCDQMRQFALRYPKYGMVTIGDCGGGTDIHPPRKRPVGERLALAALNNTYGITREYTGPLATHATLVACDADENRAENGKIRIHFTHAQRLEQRGYAYEPHGLGRFEFLYADGTKKSAPQVRIDNEATPPCVVLPIVLGDNGDAPTQVQYEFVCEPKIGLYNQVGLPASTFRVDIEGLDTIVSLC